MSPWPHKTQGKQHVRQWPQNTPSNVLGPSLAGMSSSCSSASRPRPSAPIGPPAPPMAALAAVGSSSSLSRVGGVVEGPKPSSDSASSSTVTRRGSSSQRDVRVPVSHEVQVNFLHQDRGCRSGSAPPSLAPGMKGGTEHGQNFASKTAINSGHACLSCKTHILPDINANIEM